MAGHIRRRPLTAIFAVLYRVKTVIAMRRAGRRTRMRRDLRFLGSLTAVAAALAKFWAAHLSRGRFTRASAVFTSFTSLTVNGEGAAAALRRLRFGTRPRERGGRRADDRVVTISCKPNKIFHLLREIKRLVVCTVVRRLCRMRLFKVIKRGNRFKSC